MMNVTMQMLEERAKTAGLRVYCMNGTISLYRSGTRITPMLKTKREALEHIDSIENYNRVMGLSKPRVKDKNKEERTEAAKAMHRIVQGLNDERFYYDLWLQVMPDEPTEEEFEWFGKVPEGFEELVWMFKYIMVEAGQIEKPFYIGGVLA